MLRVVVTLLLLIIGLGTHSANAKEFVGRATAIDGDDLNLCNGDGCNDIRLCGIDAPESNCAGYEDARAALQALVQGKEVKCIQVGGGTVCDGRSKPTNRDRPVAQCFVDGVDIAGALVQRGLACDWKTFSGGYYSRDGRGRACPKRHRRECAAIQRSQ